MRTEKLCPTRVITEAARLLKAAEFVMPAQEEEAEYCIRDLKQLMRATDMPSNVTCPKENSDG